MSSLENMDITITTHSESSSSDSDEFSEEELQQTNVKIVGYSAEPEESTHLHIYKQLHYQSILFIQ